VSGISREQLLIYIQPTRNQEFGNTLSYEDVVSLQPDTIQALPPANGMGNSRLMVVEALKKASRCI